MVESDGFNDALDMVGNALELLEVHVATRMSDLHMSPEAATLDEASNLADEAYVEFLEAVKMANFYDRLGELKQEMERFDDHRKGRGSYNP